MYFIVKRHCVLQNLILLTVVLGSLGKAEEKRSTKNILMDQYSCPKENNDGGKKKPNLEHEGQRGTILSSTSSKNWSVSCSSGSICQWIETTKSLKILCQIADFSLILPLATEVIFRKIILIFITTFIDWFVTQSLVWWWWFVYCRHISIQISQYTKQSVSMLFIRNKIQESQ